MEDQAFTFSTKTITSGIVTQATEIGEQKEKKLAQVVEKDASRYGNLNDC